MSDAPAGGAENPQGGDGAAQPAAQPIHVPEPASSPQPVFATDAAPASAPQPAAGRRLAPRTVVWAVIALLCAVAGTIVSINGAHSVARNDAANSRRSFTATADGIAANVNLSIQREEDLVNSTSAFFAEHPNASPAEFTAWARRGHLLRRYPELEKLALVAVVRATQLAAFEEQITGHAAITPSSPTAGATATRAAATGKAIRIIPPGDRGYYCLTAAGLARASVTTPPAGLDYCAQTGTLLAARDSGLSTYAAVTAEARGRCRCRRPCTRARRRRRR